MRISLIHVSFSEVLTVLSDGCFLMQFVLNGGGIYPHHSDNGGTLMKQKLGRKLSVILKDPTEYQNTYSVKKDPAPPERIQDYKTLAEQLAKSTVVIKNHYLDELREQFKYHDRMKRFDKMFPYARLNGGDATCKLYVDEPTNDMELDVCYQKAKIMRQMGLKYVIIEKDSVLFDLLQQVGEI
jgi:hypothetical protein